VSERNSDMRSKRGSQSRTKRLSAESPRLANNNGT
jgi:hypothetical protein